MDVSSTLLARRHWCLYARVCRVPYGESSLPSARGAAGPPPPALQDSAVSPIPRLPTPTHLLEGPARLCGTVHPPRPAQPLTYSPSARTMPGMRAGQLLAEQLDKGSPSASPLQLSSPTGLTLRVNGVPGGRQMMQNKTSTGRQGLPWCVQECPRTWRGPARSTGASRIP